MAGVAGGGSTAGGGAAGGATAGGGTAGGAQPMTCDGGFIRVTAPIQNIEDLAVYAPGSVWIAGGGNMAKVAHRVPSDGGFSAATCTDSFDGVWARLDAIVQSAM